LNVATVVGWTIRLELPAVAVNAGAELHRRLQAACDYAGKAGREVLRAVNLANFSAGNDAEEAFFVDPRVPRTDDASIR
jgi:hypothetical protein